MRKLEIAKQLARRSKVTRAEAADRLDGVIHKIVCDLRNGKDGVFPGLGRFRSGHDGRLVFEPEKAAHHD